MTPEVITLDGLDRAGNLKKWQTLLRQSVSTACTFEIHCWEDEPDAIALALRYGRKKDTGWAHGVVIALTPFFSLFLDNGFSSEHYGTELYITTEETPL